MNRTCVRLRGEAAEYRLLFTKDSQPEKSFFVLPELGNATEYEPLEIPKKGDWLYVTLDQEQIEEMIDPYLLVLTNNDDHVVTADYQRVDCIYDATDTYLAFKKLGSTNYIHENGSNVLQFSDEGATLAPYSFALQTNGQIDAYYDIKAKRLYFMSFSRVRSLFKGLDVFYQDATIPEKEQFLYSELFALGDNINILYIGLNDTKKLAAIQESQRYDFSDPDTRGKITRYAADYPSAGVGVDDEGRIIINTKKDLTAALRLLEQKFFTTQLTGEKYEATSTKRMKD